MGHTVGQFGELIGAGVGHLIYRERQVVHDPQTHDLGVHSIRLDRTKLLGMPVDAVNHMQRGGLAGTGTGVNQVQDDAALPQELQKGRPKRRQGGKGVGLHTGLAVQGEDFLPLL